MPKPPEVRSVLPVTDGKSAEGWEKDEHGGIVLAEHELLHVGGQHLGGDAGVDHVAEPEGLHDTGHGLDVLLHGNEFVGRQAFHRDHAGGRQMEVILEGYLADHGVQILRHE